MPWPLHGAYRDWPERIAEPARLVAVPVEALGEAGPARAPAIEGREGSFALQLPPEGEWVGVRAGADSVRGLPGPVVAAPLAAAASGERAG